MNENKTIIVLGRGHSGTRAIANLLQSNGIFLGYPLVDSSDLVPATPVYEACRIFGQKIVSTGNFSWNFDDAINAEIPKHFEELIAVYLRSFFESKWQWKGWKLPETTLIFPWIFRMFPDAYYLYLVRDPRDSVLRDHLTDDLGFFGIPTYSISETYQRRLLSWKYHFELIESSCRLLSPKRFQTIHFERLVLNTEIVIQEISDFLGLQLHQIQMHAETVGRHKHHPTIDTTLVSSAMQRLGYII